MYMNFTVGQMFELVGKDFKVVLITMLARNITLSNIHKANKKFRKIKN